MLLTTTRIGTFCLLLALFFPWLPFLLYSEDIIPFSLDQFALKRNAANETWNVVITGANSGLGWGTAFHLAKIPNLCIVMACRNLSSCEEARARIPIIHHNSTRLVCVELDLADRASIEAFSHRRIQRLFSNSSADSLSPIHVLINNAGFWASSEEVEYIDNIESHFFVNHLGHVLLTHYLWKRLVAGRARVVAVSSLSGIYPVSPLYGWRRSDENSRGRWWLKYSIIRYLSSKQAMIDRYVRSKRANLMFAAELDDRFRNTVTSVGSHPGYTQTPIFQKGFKFLPKWVVKVLSKKSIVSMEALDGAMMQVRAALDSEIQSGSYVGPRYWTFGAAVLVGRLEGKSLHHWHFAKAESKMLWEESLSVLGVSDFGK